ncbi:MAG TPA: hypothetical protein VIN73_11840 [Vicingaceae bacterium]
MNTTLTVAIWNQITTYVSGLDWTYIITFIIIAYGCNHHKVKGGIKTVTGVQSKTKYRVAFIGLLYGVALYFIRGYQLEKVECLFQSFVFALVFHKLILEGLTTYIGKKLRIKSVIEKEEASERGYYDRFNHLP